MSLDGGSHEDWLQAGAGADTLTGGPGVALLRARGDPSRVEYAPSFWLASGVPDEVE
jgi:hypothetical protein